MLFLPVSECRYPPEVSQTKYTIVVLRNIHGQWYKRNFHERPEKVKYVCSLCTTASTTEKGMRYKGVGYHGTTDSNVYDVGIYVAPTGTKSNIINDFGLLENSHGAN